MSRSTARFISYDLRPAKQSERRIISDILKIGGDCGLPIRKYRYVVMGANRFYDFLLLHRYIGISSMISLEHDHVMYERARFNVPFGFIDVRNETTEQFLTTDSNEVPTIYWFDYDGGIGPHILRDIASLSTGMKVGDLAFVTVYGGPPAAIDRAGDQERHLWLHDTLGDVSLDVSVEDAQRANFSVAVHKILMAAFMNGFAPRADGQFVPLLQVEYADTKPMVTVGGAFLTGGQAVEYRRKMKDGLPFLTTASPRMYVIESLNLTERERVVFDRVVTSPRRKRSDMNTLRTLGFREAEVAAYRDLVRHLPRYFESIV